MPTRYTLHVTPTIYVHALYTLIQQEHPDTFVYLCKDWADVRQMIPDFENKKGLHSHPFHVVAPLNRHPKDPPTIDDIAGTDSIAASADTTYLYMPAGLSFARTLLQTREELPVIPPLDPLIDDPPAPTGENPKTLTLTIPSKIIQEAVTRAVVNRQLRETAHDQIKTYLLAEVHAVLTPNAIRDLTRQYLQERVAQAVDTLAESERARLIAGVQSYLNSQVDAQLGVLARLGLRKLVDEFYLSKRAEIMSKLQSLITP